MRRRTPLLWAMMAVSSAEGGSGALVAREPRPSPSVPSVPSPSLPDAPIALDLGAGRDLSGMPLRLTRRGRKAREMRAR